ncbi:hypothetical protein D3C76_1017450 [compost metagenome]
MDRPFVAQRTVQKGQMVIACTEAQQLLEAGAALNPAAVIDHIGEGPPFARPFAARRVIDHGMDQLFTGIDIHGSKHKDIQAELAAFNNHSPVDASFFKLLGVVQIKRQDA